MFTDMSKGKIILVVILLGGLVGGIIGYTMWNKPHTKVEDVEGLKVSVSELYSAYDTDETAANKKYLNKVVTIKGTVSEIQENQDGNKLVILEDKIQCTMRDKNVNTNVDAAVTIKGFCNGNSLFGVVLSDCVIE